MSEHWLIVNQVLLEGDLVFGPGNCDVHLLKELRGDELLAGAEHGDKDTVRALGDIVSPGTATGIHYLSPT